MAPVLKEPPLQPLGAGDVDGPAHIENPPTSGLGRDRALQPENYSGLRQERLFQALLMELAEQSRQLMFQCARVTPKTNNTRLFIISPECVPDPQFFGLRESLTTAHPSYVSLGPADSPLPSTFSVVFTF